ncbi:uncharacterized protein LOC103097375 isoform X2 [Monodelphis domestica]|nr:uncharacterized protein LOC103097375 isoform X2 [Monodelphis domestica]XP_007496492.1 uncharacterized protein LOC103097375 isoform X2 [Monodelphis domestica]XP_056658620.1 uncharacterized protein LOC103097375 isoform X2 [Monodelphis domestica]
MEWVVFHLKMHCRIKNEMLHSFFGDSKKNLTNESELLKNLLSVCPYQRNEECLRQIQIFLKKNGSFRHLPNEAQLQLCQIIIYQEYEAGCVIIKKGHWPMECYLVLSGKLAAVSTLNVENPDSEILNEFEEGDFVGETCLLPYTRRFATIVCKSNAELLVISKKDFDYILSDIVQEQFQEIVSFLRQLPIFSSWTEEKIDFLVHYSLLRYYRAGTLVCENLYSDELIVIRSGRCLVLAQIEDDFFEQRTLDRMTPASRSSSKKHLLATPTSSSSSTSLAALATSAHYGIELSSLEQGRIFGVVEKMDTPSDINFSLVSEGAECIFIPTKIFLMEAPIRSQQMALGLVNIYPTQDAIMEHLIKKQAWDNYKARVVNQQLKRITRRTSL